MLVRLPSGVRVVIREIRAQDKELLARGLAQLSPASAHARFFTPKSRFTQRELAYLTEVDGHDHAAYVAVLADQPERLVAVGRYVRLAAAPTSAEVAIVVGDEFHGLGLGRRLALLLADHARREGIAHFSATMLADNVAAHELFAAISQHLRREHRDGVDVLYADLAA